MPVAVGETYTYRVPDYMELKPGSYVRVPLGARTVNGVVWALKSELDDTSFAHKLRGVEAVYENPPLCEEHMHFVDWVADYTMALRGMVLRMVMRSPASLGAPRQIMGVRFTGALPKKMTRQRELVIERAGKLAWRKSELARFAGVSAGVINGLLKEEVLEIAPLPALAPFKAPKFEDEKIQLTKDQVIAADQLKARMREKVFSASLLKGVTGSGKTEVYFEMIASALEQDKQVLVLLPEIALTQPFIDRFEHRFGVPPALWHSSVSERERERIWRGVSENRARIVVGTRSALFLPFSDLGLIIVDEEHDGSFKQEEGVIYHARDMAVVRAHIGQFPILLSSATPSVETRVNVEKGRYACAELQKRHGSAGLPDVELVDMRENKLKAGNWISTRLGEVIEETLSRGDQVLLFLNRRGYAPLTLCRTCGERMQCPHCSAWLVEHRSQSRLQCHHCGHFTKKPEKCPSCQDENSLVACGPGVERLAEEVRQKYPDKKIAVLSSDMNTDTPLRDFLQKIHDGEIDIIIGTQLVAKGHHFPKLTLVGIVDADIGLAGGDPRAGEHTFQLISQVSGRAGREEKPGLALVQTHMPEHPLMQALAAGRTEQFYQEEISMREAGNLPPFGRLASLIIAGPDISEVEKYAVHLVRTAPQNESVRVLGPAPAPLSMIRGRHRFRILVRTPREFHLQAYIKDWLARLPAPKGKTRLVIDIDPQSFL